MVVVSACMSCAQHLYAAKPCKRLEVLENRKKKQTQVIESGNGLPNISARTLPQSNCMNVSADVLFWCARQSGAENWGEDFSSSVLPSTNLTIDLLQVDFGWDPGFRVGVDYGMKHDQWDTQFFYTWFRTNGKDQASTSGQITPAFFANVLVGNPTASLISGPTYHNGSIQWTILFNVFDWELGRNYWVSSALSLRPFIGLKGGWIFQKIHSKWLNPLASVNAPDPSAFGVATENIKNHFGGLGPSVGLNTKWKIGSVSRHMFSLFGDISGAIMWGRWTFEDVYRNQVPDKVSLIVPNMNGGASMLRTFTGLGWDYARDRFGFAIRLGYEAQFWLDQLRYYSSPMGRLSNELTLQGGVIDVRFDF